MSHELMNKRDEKKIIGKIGRPRVEIYRTEKRKIHLIPLLFSGKGWKKNLPQDYEEKINRYWEDVEKRVDNLEKKLGKINRIYHEIVGVDGKKGIKIIEQVNLHSYKIVKKFYEKGARIEATEDDKLVRESMDWSKCLSLKLVSSKVFILLSQFLSEVMEKRDEYVSRQIDKTLQKNEIALLFIRENSSVQLPQDAQVFRIYPPVLDDIHRDIKTSFNQDKG